MLQHNLEVYSVPGKNLTADIRARDDDIGWSQTVLFGTATPQLLTNL